MQPIRTIGALVFLLAVLAACGGEGARPTATQPQATATTAATATSAPAATATSAATAAATPTRQPTATATAAPTATSLPSPTASPTGAPTGVDPVVYNDILFADVVETRAGADPELVGGIFAVDADGSDLHPITNMPEGWHEAFLSPSPDGTLIAFDRFLEGAGEGAEPGETGLYVVDIATGAEQFIVKGRAGAQWSPDGTKLLLSWAENSSGLCCCGGCRPEDDLPKLAVVNPDGSGLRVLFESTNVAETGGTFGLSPSWSPDGSSILFVRWDLDKSVGGEYSNTYSLVIMNPDGSGMHEIDTGPIEPLGRYVWSPDGKTIVFLGLDGQFTDPGLFSAAADGSRLTRVTTPDLAVPERSRFAYAPNGAGIAFQGYVVNPQPTSNYPDMSLYVISPDGSGLTQLTAPRYGGGPFVYSPDSTKIAFWDSNPGTEAYVLRVMNPDGTGATSIDAPEGVERDLAWSPDGTKLVCLVYSGGPVVAAAGGSPLEIRVVDARTGTISPALALTRDGEAWSMPVWRPTGE